MAQHLNHILGDKLLKNTLDGKAPIGLPSPEVSRAVGCPNPTSLCVALVGLRKGSPIRYSSGDHWHSAVPVQKDGMRGPPTKKLNPV